MCISAKPENAGMPSFGIVVILGMISAIGPLTVDMYLPALPMMAVGLQTTEGMMQQSLMAYFAGVALGQLSMGPFSDRAGRRTAIMFGFVVYIVAAFACLWIDNIWWLMGWRFFQGIGAAAGMVVSIAVVRDLYTGAKATQLLSMIMMITGVAPVIAPAIGSLIISHSTWRMIFLVLGCSGLLTLLATFFLLRETRSLKARHAFQMRQALIHYRMLISKRSFMPFVLTGALAQAVFYVYLSGSAFFFIELHHLNPMHYSIWFGCNALGMMLSAAFNAAVISRFGPVNVVRVAGSIYLLCCLILLILALFNIVDLIVYGILLFLALMMFPVLMPCCNMLALNAWKPIAGTASALMGTLQFICGAAGVAISGIFANGTAVPMFAVMSVFSILLMIVVLLAWPLVSSGN